MVKRLHRKRNRRGGGGESNPGRGGLLKRDYTAALPERARRIRASTGIDRIRLLGRPGGAAFDPFDKISELLRVQLFLRRHLEVALVTYRADQQAAFGLSRHNRRAMIATAEKAGARGEVEVVARRLLTVALD